MSRGSAASSRPAIADSLRRPWARAVGWLALLGPTFFVTYGFANWLAAQRADVGSVVFGWESWIPFLAWTIVPYWSIDLFYAVSLFLPRSREGLDVHAKRLLVAQAISVVCFVAFPLRFTFERPATDGVFGWLFDALTSFDQPFNQAPSLHVSLLVVLWTLYAGEVPRRWRWLVHGLAVLIGLSVLTTYQHHFFDVPTGALAGCLTLVLVPSPGPEGRRQRDPRRWSLVFLYGLAGATVGAIGQWLGGGWLWLWWPASSLGTVALIYGTGQPGRFQKARGRMQPMLTALLGPYLVGAWLNSRWWTRNDPEAAEVVPGLLLSRIPSRSELGGYDPVSLVDCCAELPSMPGGREVFSVPMLDLLVPETDQIDDAVRAIESARRSGLTSVFCALGLSRSATAVVAWLLATGRSSAVAEAIVRVREARPSVVLSRRHVERLEAWYVGRCTGAPGGTR